MELKTAWIIAIIPFIIAFIIFIRKRQKQLAFNFSSSDLIAPLTRSWKVRYSKTPYYLRLVVLTLFLLALSGPRSVVNETVSNIEGIDIVLVIDASGSMAGEDFQMNGKRYNRLDIVKDVVAKFIEERKNDRIALVAFSGLAYTVCPLTTDTSWLVGNLDRIKLGLIEDGTAIGSAIASSIARLKASDAKSKIIILLTDGMNNRGKIDPVTAAKAAAALGIKIYTIGAGTKGYVPYPVQDMWGRKAYQKVLIDLDEDTLKEVANLTKGRYFRATDTESLKRIYNEIDKLEKTKIEEHGYKQYTELFDRVLMLALILLVFEILLSNTLFFKVP